MASYIINGGNRLAGTVRTPGSKNAVLPLLASTFLFNAPVTLTNVPNIADVSVMTELLEKLGKKLIRKGNDRIIIEPKGKITSDIPSELAKRLRASVLLMGPLLARTGKVFLPQPGGDLIGRRPIDSHTEGFVGLGAKYIPSPDGTSLEGKLLGADLYMEEASVTGTENLIMAATLANGMTILRHCAYEAHVSALCQVLIMGGVQIEGVGTSTLKIVGRKQNPLTKSVSFDVPPDELDAGTFAIVALLTDGEITIDPYPLEALRPLTEKLLKIGAEIRWSSDNKKATIKRSIKTLKSFKLQIAPAPGFPTDLQPPMAVLASQANGVSLIHDWMYDKRLGYADELIKFGANVTVCDPHRVIIAGPSKFYGRRIYSPDIRAGAAFVLAGLIAEGKSQIDHSEIIERGYADLVIRLRALGADITRIEEKI